MNDGCVYYPNASAVIFAEISFSLINELPPSPPARDGKSSDFIARDLLDSLELLIPTRLYAPLESERSMATRECKRPGIPRGPNQSTSFEFSRANGSRHIAELWAHDFEVG